MQYLAAPFSNPDPSIERWRYHRVTDLLVRLLREGRVVFSPLTYSAPLAWEHDLPAEWAFWERIDLTILARCDELLVYQLPGWAESRGVAAEIAHAEHRGIPVTYLPYEPRA